VANFRVDQAWGSAQIMGAIHDASGQYYNQTAALCPGSNLTCDGNPSNAVGWAVGAGAKILLPWFGHGDYFQAQFNYSQGASGYENSATGLYEYFNGGVGGSIGLGLMSDGIYGGTIGAGTATDVQLTTSWGVNAAVEHYWSPHWQTSVYGAYVATQYNGTATAMLCSNAGFGAGTGSAAVAAAGCGANWDVWNIGTRTQFNVDSQTYIGVDVVYQQLDTMFNGGTAVIPTTGVQPAGLRTFSNQSAFMTEFRVHRNFYP
jgi:hypothetical protein